MSSSCPGENTPGAWRANPSPSAARSVSMAAHSPVASRVRVRNARPAFSTALRVAGSSVASRTHCASAVTRPSTGPLVPPRTPARGASRLAGQLGGALAAPGGERRLAIVEDAQHRAVRLGAHHRRRRLVGDGRSRASGRPPCAPIRPSAEGHDGYAGDVQRRQHARHVGRQRALVDDDQHSLGAEAAWLGEGQVGDAVQADGGLAATGRPCTAIRPDAVCVISSNWRGSMSAAIAGRWRSGRRAPFVVQAQLAADGGAAAAAARRGGRCGRARRRDQRGGRAVAGDLQPRLCAATSRQSPVRRSREKVPCGEATRRRSASTMATVRRATISPSTRRSPRRSS